MEKHPLHISSIELRHTLPAVFAGTPKRHSQIWEQDVKLERGNTYIIAAASGTGKSSMCAYIYGSRRDYSGTILFDNQNVADFNIDHWLALRRTALAYLPQELDLFPELSAWQNIELKRRLTDFTPPQRVEEWMEQLGIADRRDFPVGKMSIGQQQRVGIIRSVCQPFDFIMLDEPVSHLDAENNRLAAKMILDEALRQGAAVVATSVGNHLAIPQPIMLEL